jgi:hypothetical protein
LNQSEIAKESWKNPEIRKKRCLAISESMKGNIPWNKGLTKKDSEVIYQAGSNEGNRRRGLPRPGNTENWSGWHHTPEAKEKISEHRNLEGCRLGQQKAVESRKANGNMKWPKEAPGRTREKYLGRVGWSKGLTRFTNESLRKMSDNMKKYPEEIDREAYGWTDELKKEIRLRDRYTCQICGKDHVCIVHHRDWDCRNNTHENLIILCRACHAAIHARKEFEIISISKNELICVGA